MSRPATCLKTGCQLQVGGLFYWGDLHELNEATLIFNACLDERGEAAPRPDRGPSWETLETDGGWERRGVFVLDKASCVANLALERFLAGAPHVR